MTVVLPNIRGRKEAARIGSSRKQEINEEKSQESLKIFPPDRKEGRYEMEN